ncbi:MAG: Rne/Rng family ribonuclease [Prevotellaceae bacterium]|nr:Rne/Rng family ribonuclease [Prevotellaceae bacterium]
MNSELVIDVQPSEVSIALLEDKNLVELSKEGRLADSFSVGDIYLGRVKKIMPGLNAAFVDVGYGKDAFLHYLDLGHQFVSLQNFLKQALADRKKTPVISRKMMMPDIEKNGEIAGILTVGQPIAVQISKEPISTKGPRLTSELSIAGRCIVLVPFSEKISVSSKIKSGEERTRLRQLVQSIKPKNFGVIIRTAAEGKRVAELDNELKLLLKRWDDAVDKIQQSKGVCLICEEMGRTLGILRDIFDSNFQSIHVNNEQYYREIRDYVALIDPEKKGIVKYYDGDLPIFDKFDITRQMKSSFGRTVSVKSGAYLIIEHTEAMYVIDVNSGTRTRSSEGQEMNALEVNMAAANEIVRQLRLRDMGGIIVVDFIDMQKGEHRQKLYDHVRELMEKDRSRHNILPLSKFGVMQITRQRVRPATRIAVEETCPTCYGRGKMAPAILFTDQLEQKIAFMVNDLKIKRFKLHIHPFVEAYVKKGFYSLYWQWKFRYGFGVKVIPSQRLGFLQYKFYDVNNEEIDLSEE